MTSVTVSQAGLPAGRRSRSRFSRRLLVGASASVLASLLPAMALGQAVPAGCLPTPATAGDTIDCVVAGPATVDGIATTVDDLTINIGSLATPTAVENLAGYGIDMSGSGSLFLNLIGAGSSVSGSTAGVQIFRSGAAGALTVTSAGSISGGGGHGIYAHNDASGTDLTIAASGLITGSTNGIGALNYGAGALSITTASVTGTTGHGIRALNFYGSTDLTMIANGAVTGGDDGINVANLGAGALNITTAAVTGTAGDGLDAFNSSASTDITITASDTIIGGSHGINARNSGSGALSLIAVAATGTNGDGIYVYNSAAGTDLTVTASGAATGGDNGVYAQNYGTGALSITTQSVAGTAGHGIRALNFYGSTDLTLIANGAVTGGDDGINAHNLGAGALSITTAAVTGATGDGINAFNSVAGTDLTIAASGTVTGQVSGIDARNSGSGALSITAAAVTATTGDGIYVYNSAAGTDLTINATGAITGGGYGVSATNYGTGALSITTAAVTGTLAGGVAAYNSAASTDLTVTAIGTVTGGEDGIYAINLGTGSLTISAATVTGTAGDGIYASNSATGTDMSIAASGTVTGGDYGIYAQNYGTGSLTINAAAVTGTNYAGIQAYNSAAGTGLSITATGAVTGGEYGVDAANYGTGALSIATAAVTGTLEDGIAAYNSAAGTDLTITASGAVIGGEYGIYATNLGTGSLSIGAAAVAGTAAMGIYARNSAAGTDMTVAATGTVFGNSFGIDAANYGTGAVSVTTAAVTGTLVFGIGAYNSAAGTDLSITANGDVSGGQFGIYTINAGSGALTINAGAVTGNGVDGIDAQNTAAGTSISVTATGLVTGVHDGIDVDNYGSGALTINAAAITAGHDGIEAVNSVAGTDLTVIASGAIAGGFNGVYARNYGTGALSVTTAAVSGTGAGYDGIYARNSTAGTDLTVMASGAVSGSERGIYARNDGSGALSITAAAVTGTNNHGIRGRNQAAGTDLTITASGAVNGGYYGVYAINYGTGAMSISTAAVTGAARDGIRGFNAAGSTALTITATGTVTGDLFGVFARNYGSGALGITTATVTGTTLSGIFATNSAAGSDLTIAATGAVTGSGHGVYARNSGSGALSISTAAVTGASDNGIWARNQAAGTDLNITAGGAATGALFGVEIENFGGGATVIDVASVTGTANDGIFAHGYSASTGLSITASGTVSGGRHGIQAYDRGTGNLTINVAAVTGTAGHGIYAHTTDTTDAMSITASGLVSTDNNGIHARHWGDGALLINVADVTASSTGVYARTDGAALSVTSSGTIIGADGVNARNYGIGALTMDLGAVTATNGVGVYASSLVDGTALNLTASGNVSGSTYGIIASNRGSGDLTINAASVSGTSGVGIFASNYSAGDLSITASGPVSGGIYGVQAEASVGNLSVDVADVTGVSGNGIRTYAGYGALSTSIISSGLVSSGGTGITVTHSGSGALSIHAANISGGQSGIFASTGAGSTDASITSTGTVTGSRTGLFIGHRGSGGLTIDVATVSGAASGGIDARSYAGSGALSITASAAVTGGTSGVYANHSYGAGAVELNLASVTGYSRHAVTVGNGLLGTHVTLIATGSVTGALRGMEVANQGSGALTIDVADVTGINGEGIFAYNSTFGTELSITSSGLVTGGNLDGIDVSQRASAMLAIDVVNVTATNGTGIDAYSAGGASLTSTGTIAGSNSGVTILALGGGLDLDVNHVTANSATGILASTGYATDSLAITSRGLVSAGGSGILATHSGTGALTINAADMTTGASGITATALTASTDLSINITGTLTSVNSGVIGLHSGSGALAIAVTEVNANAGYGVLARNFAGTSLSVTATGAVAGYGGINARNYGSGATLVDVAAVTGVASGGIRAFGGLYSTDMSITASGAVTGSRSGIFADHRGSGMLTIDANTVTATAPGHTSVGNGTAINATTTGAGLSITTSGAVTGIASGIDTTNLGSGALTVLADQVTGSTDFGITASSGYFAGTDIHITATGAVYGGRTGVLSRNLGYGATMIDLASAAGGLYDGINAFGGSDTTNLSITATGSVTGGNIGVIAEWAGIGALAVSVADVTGVTGYGIFLRSTNGTGISLTASGAVSGAGSGVKVRNFGTGATTIDLASATGGSEIGVYASGGAGTTDLSITADGTVSGGRSGIMALWDGSGALTVDISDVTSTTDDGILLQSSRGTGMSLTASGTVTGGYSGIVANHFGTGTVSINVADVSGDASGYAGISTYNGNYGTDLSVTASGAISGARFGLRAVNTGSGVVDISATDVSSGAGVAISLRGSGTDIGVTTTGTVTGDTGGIYVNNHGSGGTTVTVSNVSSSSNSAIYAINRGTDLTITATGTVSGGTGIAALQSGAGGVIIDAAAVTGTTGNGIYAYQTYAGSGLSVSATGTVTGYAGGISAVNFGGGGLAIQATTVSGATGSGIAARTGGSSDGLSVIASGTVSGRDGISLSNNGFGALTLTAVDVEGSVGFGINAYGGRSSSDMTVTAAYVTGAIRLWALGSGVTSLDIGNVTSHDASAINAYAGGNSAGLDVTVTGNAHGNGSGIGASNRSATGSVSITVAGAVTGDTAFGISAYNAGSGGLSITVAGDVTGGIVGVFARNLAGAMTLDIGGDITGGSYGLLTETIDGTNFDVRAGQSVTGGRWGIVTGSDSSAATSADTLNISGTVIGGIFTGNGDDTITLAAGSVVDGMIMLEDHDDTLNYAGGSFGAARGGSGSDTVNFSGPGVRITNTGGYGDIFGEFEIYNFLTGGYVLDGLHRELVETNFLVGDHILLGRLHSENVLIAAGTGLEVAHGASITGNLINAGNFSINGTAVGQFSVYGNLTQVSTGAMTLDVNAFAGWGDAITVTGDVAAGGTLALRQYGSFGAPLTLINGAAGLTGTFDSVSGFLASRLLVSQAIEYDAASGDINLVTAFAEGGTVAGLTPNQAAVANGLTGQLAALPDNQAFTDFAYSVAALDDADALSAALEQLNPEVLDAGVQAARNSQFLFLTGLLNRSGTPAPGPQPVQVASLDNSIPDWSSSQDAAHVWGSLQMVGYEQSGGGANIDYTTDGVEIAFGAADLKAGAVRFGFAIGYAGLETDLAGPDDDQVSSELFRYGLFGRYDINPGDHGLQAHVDGGLALGRGSLETRMDVLIPASGTALTQSGETHFDTAAGAVRLTLDGYNGHNWIVHPHLVVATDRYEQSAQMIGYGTTTAIASEGFELDRVSYGYGATFEHQWGAGSALEVSATALHHNGDAATGFSSSFAAPGLGGVGFNTVGREIQEQYILQGRFSNQLVNGFNVSVEGFAEFGDLDGAGAEVRLSKRF